MFIYEFFGGGTGFAKVSAMVLDKKNVLNCVGAILLL